MDGKVALITGASSGIGAAIARECAKRGASVVLVARRKNVLDDLVKELGDKALAVGADVTIDGDMERAVAEAVAKFGQLDVVVANAGFGVIGNFEELTMSDWKRQFETNVFGALRTMYASLPELKKSKGAIGVVGSVMGYFAAPGGTAYSASKAVVRNVCNGIRPELLPQGVSVTHLAPGFIATDIRKVDNHGRLAADAKDPVPPFLIMPVDECARQMVNALLKRKREIVVTGHGKLTVALANPFPAFFTWAFGLASPKRRAIGDAR